MNSPLPQAVGIAGQAHNVTPTVSASAQGASPTLATGNIDFQSIRHIVSDTPLRRPNRTRPESATAIERTAAERLVPSRDELRRICDGLPFPEGWYEEIEKPF